MLGTHNCSSNFYATCASWKLVSSAFFQITSFALLFRILGCNFFNFFIDASLSYDLCNKCKANLWPFKQKKFQRLFSGNFLQYFVVLKWAKIDFRRENRYFNPLKIELWCLGKKWIWPKYQNPKCLLDLFFQVSLRRTVKSSPIFVVLLSWRSQQEAALSEVENGICCCHWLISASAALSMEGKQRA